MGDVRTNPVNNLWADFTGDTDDYVSWKNSDENVAKVNSFNGEVTATCEGGVTIVATLNDVHLVTYKINVS